MMIIIFSKKFKKKYKNLKKGENQKFKERRNIFLDNCFHPILNNHALNHPYERYRSIDITGDLRVHYERLDEGTALFITIDTHSNLYK